MRKGTYRPARQALTENFWCPRTEVLALPRSSLSTYSFKRDCCQLDYGPEENFRIISRFTFERTVLSQKYLWIMDNIMYLSFSSGRGLEALS